MLLHKNAIFFFLLGFKIAAYHAFNEEHLKLKGQESFLQKPSYMTKMILEKAGTFVTVVVVIIKTTLYLL